MSNRNATLATLLAVGLSVAAVALPDTSDAGRAAFNARSARAASPPPAPPGRSPVSGAATRSRVNARSASPWQPLANPPPFNPGAMLLLTNGTVIVQDQGPSNAGTGDWWRLVPDISGSYLNGTWSRIAPLPVGYAPLYFASAVLPDGRVIIEGGEFNSGKETETNRGAIYDPLTNAWKAVAHPKGSEWVRIGDAPSTVLADGRFMLGASGYSGSKAEALLNANTLTWMTTGGGKADGNGEEGWSLLPSGKVLVVDTTDSSPTRNTEIYSPSTGTWASAGLTPVPLIDSVGEVGPQLLQPDGRVLAVGSTGKNAVYSSASGTWSAGPSFPVIGGKQYDSADGSAAVLPDGDILVNASPGVYKPPTHFFLFNGTTLTQVADPPNAGVQSSNDGYMLVLPTGQILFNDRIGDMEVFNSSGSPKTSWRPVITSVPSKLVASVTYQVSGRQLNGLTQASAYGDDFQSATNYPLVQITNSISKHVFYARTSGMSSMSVAPGTQSTANFALPPGVGVGPSTLVVVANGIASAPVSVTIRAAA